MNDSFSTSCVLIAGAALIACVAVIESVASAALGTLSGALYVITGKQSEILKNCTVLSLSYAFLSIEGVSLAFRSVFQDKEINPNLSMIHAKNVEETTARVFQFVNALFPKSSSSSSQGSQSASMPSELSSLFHIPEHMEIRNFALLDPPNAVTTHIATTVYNEPDQSHCKLFVQCLFLATEIIYTHLPILMADAEKRTSLDRESLIEDGKENIASADANAFNAIANLTQYIEILTASQSGGRNEEINSLRAQLQSLSDADLRMILSKLLISELSEEMFSKIPNKDHRAHLTDIAKRISALASRFQHNSPEPLERQYKRLFIENYPRAVAAIRPPAAA